MGVYYNDNDPFICAWLRELIKEGLIAPGEVDERSIKEVSVDDLKGFTQHHFFAGIGGWSVALRLAGWPDDKPVWTGSCPCQPYSTAGKGLAEKDPRNLWPDWRRLISQREPTAVFGEQVASPAGRKWLSGVRSDLETLGYAVGAADLCVAGVGSPQIRQRLWWVGFSNGSGSQPGEQATSPLGYGCATIAAGDAGGLSDTSIKQDRIRKSGSSAQSQITAGGHDPSGGIPDSPGGRHGERSVPTPESGEAGRHQLREARPGEVGELPARLKGPGATGRLLHSECGGRHTRSPVAEAQPPAEQSDSGYIAGSGNHPWDEFDILGFADGKARRVEPGTFPLAHGVPARVGRLRGYGNAINPQTAATFIRAVKCS